MIVGKLEAKVVLITGGARGQGASECRLAATEGATVIVSDVLDDEGRAVAEDVGGAYHRLDVSSASAWREVIGAVMEAHGRIDGLVNNAGIFRLDGVLEAIVVGVHSEGRVGGADQPRQQEEGDDLRSVRAARCKLHL